MVSFRQDLEQRLANPEFAEAYEQLKPEQDVIRAMIRARNELGITQAELAERTGIRQSNLSRIESGSCSPRVDTLQKIAAGLGKKLIIQFK